MLRSYQYTEKPYLEYTFQGNFYRDKQVQIARRFVESHPIRRDGNRRCPICGGIGAYFYSKWKVDYLCCGECRSVYAVYEDEVAQAYQAEDELLELRRSEEYQQEITDKRQGVWEEFLEWVEVRAFRFMGRNRNLDIVDYGNRYKGYGDAIRNAAICGRYDLRDSILSVGEDRSKSGEHRIGSGEHRIGCGKDKIGSGEDRIGSSEDKIGCGKDKTGFGEHRIGPGEADLVLYLDQMQQELHPVERMRALRAGLKEDGLLILNTRAGSGFDIITLKEKNDRIYPYEHILLPSVKGLVAFLEQNGFEVLEITTPGVMDVKYVLDSKDGLDTRESFVGYLLEESSQSMLQEFQRFLQKACLSSFVCVIARKRLQQNDSEKGNIWKGKP